MGGDAGPGPPPVRPGALILPGRREERNRRKSLRRDGEETERGGKEADLQHQEKKTERDGQKEDWDNSSSHVCISQSRQTKVREERRSLHNKRFTGSRMSEGDQSEPRNTKTFTCTTKSFFNPFNLFLSPA